MKPAYTHDRFFKETFSKKEEAMDLISHVFPENIVKRLDLSTLKPDNNSYINKELNESFSDLVYNCQYAGKFTIKIALLFEHKSKVPDHPHLQLLKYCLGVWDTNIKQKQPFVPVIPLIIYHGKKKWEHKKFEEYFPGSDEFLTRFLPGFDYLLADLSTYSDEEIENLFNNVSVQIGLRLMKNIFNEHELEIKLSDIYRNLESLLETEAGREYLITTLYYLFYNVEIDKDEITKTLNKISEEGGKLAMTTAMKLKREGKIEGKIEGKLENQKEFIIKLYEIKGFSVREISDLFNIDEIFIVNTLRENGLIK